MPRLGFSGRGIYHEGNAAKSLMKGKKMAPSSVLSYSIPQRILHWLMFVLIGFNLIFTEGIEHWHHVMRDGGTPTPDEVSSANIHAYVGIAILCLAVLRLALLLVHGAPDAPVEEPPVFRLAAKVAHGAFYLLFFAMPLSGIAAYYFGIGGAGSLHAGVMKSLLWVLIAVHVAALFVHRFYWRTAVFSRMTRG